MKKLSVLCALAALTIGSNAFALDTTELLDDGGIEVVPDFTLDSLHKDTKPSVGANLTAYYGVSDFMTISGRMGMATSEALTGAGVVLDVGAIFTPLDTEMFDIDAMFNVAYDSIDYGDYGAFVITPGVEFNLDSDNDMSLWGAFVAVYLPIYSGNVTEEGSMETAIKTDVEIDVDLGVYFMAAEGHQILVGGGVAVSNLAKNLGEIDTEGYVALGYNVTLFDNFELISEVKVTIPKETDDTYAALTIGGVFDLLPRGNSASASSAD